MTFHQLTADIARRHDTTHKLARALVETTFALVLTAAAQGTRVHIPGIGVFTRRKRKSRHIANPQTGEPMRLPAQAFVGFRASKTWRELPPKPRKSRAAHLSS